MKTPVTLLGNPDGDSQFIDNGVGIPVPVGASGNGLFSFFCDGSFDDGEAKLQVSLDNGTWVDVDDAILNSSQRNVLVRVFGRFLRAVVYDAGAPEVTFYISGIPTIPFRINS